MGRSLAIALAACAVLVAVVSGGLLLSPGVPSLPKGTVELRPGASFSRQLSGGKVETFAIRLRKDEFLRAVVEQQGIDVVVSLLDPGGRSLFKTDRRNGAFAPELVEDVSEAAGWHLLQVRALHSGASGRYTVRLEELRPAGPKERLRARASLAFTTGETLWRGRDFDRIREVYRAALRDWQAVEDSRGIADAQARLGEVAAELGDLNGARHAYDQAIAIYGRLNDSEEIRLLNELGRLHHWMAEPDAAETSYLRALQLAHGHGDQVLKGRVLNNLGFLYASQAAPRKALAAYDEAREVWRSLEKRAEEATTLYYLGSAYTVLGRLPQASVLLQQALDLWEVVDDPQGKATTLTAIAWIHTLEGKYPEALRLYDEALALQKAEGDQFGEAATLDRRGTALARMGRQAEAFDSYSRALRIFRQGGGTGSEAPTLANLGWLAMASGDLLQGERLLQEALSLLQRSLDRHGEAHTLLGLAQAARQRRDPALALKRVEEAITLVEALRREAPGTELRVSYGAQRYGYYELWIDLLMDHHLRRPAEGFDIRALEASERGRVHGLLESLGGQESTAAGTDLPESARFLSARIQKLESLRFQLVLGGARPEQVEAVERKLGPLLLERNRLALPVDSQVTPRPSLLEIRRLLDTDTLLLEYAVGEERSFLWVLGADGLLATEVLPKRSTLEAQTRRTHELLSSRSRRATSKVVQKVAADLRKTLLGPVADHLAGKRLLIVPDGPLHGVPFAALPARPEGPPLLADHEIVLAPSASALAFLRREQARRPAADGALALIADPVFGADDPRLQGVVASAPPADFRGGREPRLPRLPHSRREAEAILRLLSPSAKQVAALDFAADRGAVLDGLLSGYRIIHFATHASLDPEQPELSGLVLSMVDASGLPRDGLLRAYEIRGLDLSADLVVLSACSTGVGRELRGEGPLGLSRAFLSAGASRVVVSLWDVEDKSTAELMSRFYESHLAAGLSPAQALRQAQLSIWRDPRWAAPYYWSGFVLEGDWR